MDPVHIAKGEENAQDKVDACLARLWQMMLDSDNAWEFDMQGTGAGTALATLVVAPAKVRKPQTEFTAETVVNGPDAPAPTEEPPAAEVVAVSDGASPAE